MDFSMDHMDIDKYCPCLAFALPVLVAQFYGAADYPSKYISFRESAYGFS